MLSIKAASLALLCVWMTLLTERPAGTPPYKAASAVILAEFGKLLVSVLLAYRECKKAIKQERRRLLFPSLHGSGMLFDALESNLEPQADRGRPSRRGSATSVYRQEDLEEEKEALLPAMGSTSSSAPMSKQTSSQSSTASYNKNALVSNTRRRESSTSSGTDDDDDSLPEYPGSPSDRLRCDFSTEHITPSEVVQRMKEDTFGPDWMKLSVPAFLFTGQSNLSYFASTNLSVPVFQITYQLKIPATALCSVLMLNRALSHMQWFAIVLLSVGVGIVQLASSTADKVYHTHNTSSVQSSSSGFGTNNSTVDPLLEHRSRGLTARAAVEHVVEHVEMNQLLGLLAVVLACLSSGFSGVFFERQLKRSPPPPSSPATPDSTEAPARKTGLWIRNIQLSMFSLLVGTTIYAISSPSDIPDFLIGFTPMVWFVVFVQIVGGLLAAIVIQYADNIAKTFSASCSIILSFAVSIAFFDFRLSPGVVVGATAVLFATWLFTYSAPTPANPSVGSSFLPTSLQSGSPAASKIMAHSQSRSSPPKMSAYPATFTGAPDLLKHDSELRRPSVLPGFGPR